LVVRSLLVLSTKLAAVADIAARTDAPVFVVSRSVMATIAGFDVHRGVLACLDRPVMPSVAELVATSRRLVVCEGINTAENLGALVRTASGLGWDGFICDPTCVDPFYRRAVRVSMGESLVMPFARDDAWPASLDLLAASGFSVVALTPSAPDTTLDEIEQSERLAIVVGAEGPGLTSAALARCGRRAAIEMAGGVDSLNVAVASSIAMYVLRP
jgi:tRNA G18 (ribose-2'-O)-methylase SpoU